MARLLGRIGFGRGRPKLALAKAEFPTPLIFVDATHLA